jgi:hypothetical protein
MPSAVLSSVDEGQDCVMMVQSRINEQSLTIYDYMVGEGVCLFRLRENALE